MVKDRLAEFKKKADIKENDDQVTVYIENQDNEQFIEKVDNIHNDLDQMETLIKEMKNFHSTMLLSAKPDEKIKKSLEDININFKMLSKRTKQNIKTIDLDIEGKNVNSAAYRIAINQHNMLRQKLLDVIDKYNSAQVDYQNKNKDLLIRQVQITNVDVSNEDLDKYLEKPSEIFIQGLLTESREAREQLEEIQARHADIIKIEKSIRELHEMFLDMANLVESQGEMVNRIENQVKSTCDYVEQGKEQTKQAMENKAKALKCKIYIAVALVLLVLLIVWASL